MRLYMACGVPMGKGSTKEGKLMGLRFRKSFKVAPGVKVNLNKKSTSVTFGKKGVHRTISSTGKKTTSVGIPGSGLYYTSTTGGKSKKKAARKKLDFHENEPFITESDSIDSIQSDSYENLPNPSLAKFSTQSLQRYKTAFLVLAVFVYLMAILCFANSSYGMGLLFALVGLMPVATVKTYSKEISTRLLFSTSGGSNSGGIFSRSSSGVSNKSPKKMGCGCLTIILLFLLLIGGMSSCSSSDDTATEKAEDTKSAVVTLESLTISADTDQTYDINTDVPVELTVTPADANIDNLTLNSSECTFVADGNEKLTFSADGAGSYIISVSCDGIESNDLTIDVEDKAAIAEEKAQAEAEAKAKEEAARQAEAEAARKAEEEAAAQKAEEERIAAEQAAQEEQIAQQSEESQGQMVWISETGSKYHSRPDCGRMNPDNAWQLTLSDAEAQGYEPCKKCY